MNKSSVISVLKHHYVLSLTMEDEVDEHKKAVQGGKKICFLTEVIVCKEAEVKREREGENIY